MSVRDEEKLMRFVNEALGEAEGIAERIDSEVTAEEKKRLDEGEHKILTEVYERIQSEMKKIRREIKLLDGIREEAVQEWQHTASAPKDEKERKSEERIRDVPKRRL